MTAHTLERLRPYALPLVVLLITWGMIAGITPSFRGVGSIFAVLEGFPLVGLAALDGPPEVLRGLREVGPRCVRLAALVEVPPVRAPDVARRHAVFFAVFLVNPPLVRGGAARTEEGGRHDEDRRADKRETHR